MRQITIPKPFIMGAGPAQYGWRQFCAEFIFFDVRWMGEEWKPAFDRVEELTSTQPGERVNVSDLDWEKLCESIRGTHERMRPELRMDLVRMAHAVTCAPKAPEEAKQETAPS